MEIYKAVNKINGKIYIGQTTLDTETRKNGHFREARSSKKTNTRFHNAINKYGEDNFEFTCIDTANTLQELNAKEIYWIDYYNSTDRNIGYNIEMGGQNSPMSESTRRKIGVKTKDDWSKPEVAARMMAGLNKATEKWVKVCEENRETVKCKYCGSEFKLPPHQARDRLYCDSKCRYMDNSDKLLESVNEARRKMVKERTIKARNIVEKWINSNSKDIHELVDILKLEFNLKDHRSVIKYVTGDKGTYKQLNEYIKSVRD